MSEQYDEMMGSPMDVSNHPDNSQNYKMAGDVVPIRDIGTIQGTLADVNGRLGQFYNLGKAQAGYKDTDMSNIKILRPTGK